MTAKYEFLILTLLGYTENLKRVTGGEKIRDRLIGEFGNHAGVEIPWPFEWRADWKEVAALIARHVDENTIIIVWCYSWGAGWGSLRLAEELAKYGIKIHYVLMVDPVYRKRWTPTRPQWLAGVTNPRSMLGRTDWGRSVLPIKVPDNMQSVQYVRQTGSVPAGRELVAANGDQDRIKDLGVLPYVHGDIDDSQEVMDSFLDLVSNVIHGTDFANGQT